MKRIYSCLLAALCVLFQLQAEIVVPRLSPLQHPRTLGRAAGETALQRYI